ncbi:hypothetical protein [Winogradskyella immobilis]|uniref:Uncharacterized protein n=1 Tax=Winogradskyella immobilis TaxID=2816852 RepID=A0ABS8EPL0_9FLAO|nr:hypothetical protein [Winogradskyella immobilis]MCC1485155.1 hypothetical protein [Winogradskyella immobilis]MCG0017247.1 hypothetical protein [Winogradskyella immobilis]
MRIFTLVIVFLFITDCFGQKKYYDRFHNEISKKEFNLQKDSRRYIVQKIKNDSLNYEKLLSRSNVTRLNKELRLKVAKELELISGSKIDSTNIIIINFYFKPPKEYKGSCIDHYTSDKSYKRFIKKRADVSQYFITEKGYQYKRKEVIEDKNGLIRALLFRDRIPCGNYVIITPKKYLFKTIGEYRQSEISFIIENELKN